jgi:hypothetical protein
VVAPDRVLEGAPGVLAYAIGPGTRCSGRLAELTYPALSAQRVDNPDSDTELTDDHMRLLEWPNEHPTGSLTAAAQALDLEIAEVEAICADLFAAGMIARAREQ